MSARDDVVIVLAESCLSTPGGFHSWCCEHPDMYGPCDCLDELVNDLLPIVAEAERRGAERGWAQGMALGKSRAMRHMSDEPYLPLPTEADNPYRRADQ